MNTLVLSRKLMYVGAIVLLLVPLYFLGHPSVRDKEGEPTNEGGVLARLRTRDDLGQSDLGALDPASESARLATLGLRGVAATILWQKAEYYKREKYFDRMAATVNQLKILQPHFVKVWDFQAHNLSYNVSVEFDDYKLRYDWVKKGIYYLLEGCRFNKARTELPFQLGDFFASKMGIADEKLQFRELFRNDASFHKDVETQSKLDMTQQAARGPDGKPDNWRSGALWFNRAYDMVDKGSRPAKSSLMFYCKSPQAQLKHSEAIQTEGKFLGEPARNAWRVAGEQLRVFGQRQIRTSFGTIIYLSELEKTAQDYAEKEAEFQEFCGDVYTRAYQKQAENLDDLQREAIKKDSADLTFDEMIAAERASQILYITPESLARKLPSEKQLKGLELAAQLKTLSTRREHIDRYRAQVNYTYWESRCRAEQEDAALDARSKMFQANASLDKGKLDEAIELYEQAWKAWDALFNRFPEMMIDDDAAEGVENSMVQYLRLIEKDLDNLPENFLLKNFLEFRKLQKQDLADPAMLTLISSWSKRYPDRNFLEEILTKSVSYAEVAKQNRDDEVVPPPPIPGQRPRLELSNAEPKPEEPKPEEPKPEKPKSEEPKPEEPKPVEPKIEEPKPEEPKTEEPKTEEPKTEEPKTEEPKTEEPKSEEPKTEEPKSEEPKTEEPKSEEPKSEEPKSEEPKSEEPKSEEPKSEEPKSEEPKPEEPKPEEPKPEEPKPGKT